MKKIEVNSNRIQWIDMAKGIGIILVILGHGIFPNKLIIWLYSFHMPLFFFLSGAVFSINRYSTFKDFSKHKINTLLIPSLYFAIIINLVNYGLSILSGKTSNINIVYKVSAIFLELRGGKLGFIPWYLTCLFICSLLMYPILRYISLRKIFVLSIVMSIIGYLYSSYLGIVLPWSIDIAINGLPFMILGYLFTKRKLFFNNYIFNIKMFPIYFLFNIICGSINYILTGKRLDMYINSYGNYFLYIGAAISGILMTIVVCKKIVMPQISFIGRNSLIYYCLHNNIMDFIYIILGNNIKNSLSSSSEVHKFYIGLIILCLTCTLLYYIAQFINKKAKFLLGK